MVPCPGSQVSAMRKKLHLAQSCWPFDAAMGLLHMRKASSMALILIFLSLIHI